jgi:hypothetical protein
VKYNLSLAGAQSAQELWVNAQNKEGVIFKTIWNCTDINRFEKEEPETAKKISVGLEEFLKKDAKNIEVLKKFTEGYRLLIDDFEYKIIQFNDGSRKLSKQKKGGAGGYTAGKRPFTLFRTVMVKAGKINDVSETINNQEEGDNWEIVYTHTDAEGDHFLMCNKKPYTPPSATAVDTTKGDGSAKEENSEQEEHTE